MAEIIYNEQKGEWAYRQMLRCSFIDYFNGCFFITFQVYHNKSVFGAIVGEECVLNELGEAVKAAWRSEPQYVAGLQLGEFVVMPNHFHAIVEYHSAGRGGPAGTRGSRYTRAPDARDLPYVVGLFKSYTTHIYYKFKEAGKCLDIGRHLWHESFYDELIRGEEQYRATARYISNNPANWNGDRFGAVTSYAEGNLDLLQTDYVAYMSSEGRMAEGGLPFVRYGDSREHPCSCRTTASGSRAAAPDRAPIISTFTSYYERQVLARCLAGGRRVVWVCPGGIGDAALLQTATARAAGLALLISPVAAGTGVNKQRANWCNQFIAKNAKEIWVGHLRPGGSLETILKDIQISI